VEVADLPFYLGLMEHLAARGLRCPTPVKTWHGERSGELNGRAAAILTFLDGISLRRPGPEHCQRAGRALAQLHEAGATFGGHRDNALGPKGWHELAAGCTGGTDSVTDGLSALISEELAALDRLWPTGLPQGVIHADLFPDNVLFVNDQVSGLIDFYFACNDALAYDLAVMVNAWCFESDGAFNATKGRSLMAGYQSRRQLTPEEKAAFPVLCRGAALRFLLTRTYDWINRNPAALVRPKDPREFAKRLRFHRTVKNPEAYGL
jgi:homoserine kinase type II